MRGRGLPTGLGWGSHNTVGLFGLEFLDLGVECDRIVLVFWSSLDLGTYGDSLCEFVELVIGYNFRVSDVYVDY